MKKVLVGLLLFAMLSGCAAPPIVPPPPNQIAAAAEQGCVQTDSPPLELAKQTGYRQIVVSAQARNGASLEKLSSGDLRLSRGSKEIPIEFFQQQTVSVGILVDTSGSMETKLPAVRASLTDFIRVLDHNDIFLAAFSDRFFMLAPLTTDQNFVIDRLSTLHAYGRTALYNAVLDGLHIITKGCGSNKVLLVITDGMDNASSPTLDQVKEEARKTGIPIYAIGIGRSNFPPFKLAPSWFANAATQDLEAVDMKTLTILAQASGGRASVVEKLGDGEALTKAAMTVADTISDHYILGFLSGTSPDEVRIQLLNHKDSTLKVEGGQVAIMDTSSASPQPTNNSK